MERGVERLPLALGRIPSASGGPGSRRPRRIKGPPDRRLRPRARGHSPTGMAGHLAGRPPKTCNKGLHVSVCRCATFGCRSRCRRGGPWRIRDRAGGRDRRSGGRGLAHHHRARPDQRSGSPTGWSWLPSREGTAPCTSVTRARAARSSSRWWSRRPASRFGGTTRPARSPSRGNSLLVEFTLAAEGSERTRLRVVESGLDLLAWPDAEKERYAEEHNGGWATFLGRLAGLLADRTGG